MARRIRNPLHVRRLYNIVTAKKGSRVLYLNAKDKLSVKEVDAKRFPNADAAVRRTSAVLRQFPKLRAYSFEIRFAYG